MNISMYDPRLIGYCRFCRAPILHGEGATCNHKGYLIYEPCDIFYQGPGGYKYTTSISPLAQFTGEVSIRKDASDCC